MLDIIQNNPYRLLGIYSNSPARERVANHNRLKAFLKVGKPVSFPLDLPSLLPPIARIAETVTEADAKLTLPNEQLRYAQFWFVKVTPMDDIAMNHLIAGNMKNALSIWARKENASSLQNRIISALMQDDYRTAIAYADKLYSSYISDFASIVLGENHTVTTDNLAYDFLDELCSIAGSQQILPYITNEDWKQHLRSKTITPLVEALQTAIDAAKASKGAGITARLTAGTKLMNETKSTLAQLKTLLSDTDLQYQVIADKVGLEILQCGIDYYNGSEDADAAYNAMKLQAYASFVVVGRMAKDRCQENVNILQKIIDNLPPKEIFEEDKAIKKEFRKFQQETYHLKGCKELLFRCVPYLISIKEKIGAKNESYVQISTVLANILLNFVIEEFNKEVNDELKHKYQKNEGATLFYLMWTLRFCWNIIVNIELLDTSKEFQRDRLVPNKDTIKKFITQLDSRFSELPDYSIGIEGIVGDSARHFLRQYNEFWAQMKTSVSSKGRVNQRWCTHGTRRTECLRFHAVEP